MPKLKLLACVHAKTLNLNWPTNNDFDLTAYSIKIYWCMFKYLDSIGTKKSLFYGIKTNYYVVMPKHILIDNI